MDLSIPGSTPNSPLVPVFGDNVQDLLGTGTLNVNPSAIITVNSTNDAVDDPNSGVTTLRDAINQANGDTGEDLIVFDRSLFSNAQTITLSFGELDLTHNLNIIAPRDSLTGGDLVTVSGNNASRVFEIGRGATVTLSGLIVADGSVTRDDGGGIKNSGTLTLDSSIVSNNSAISTFETVAGKSGTTFVSPFGGNGGGIYNYTGTVNINNSTISGNSADSSSNSSSGGGIESVGTVNLNNSNISGNSASNGGGIDSNGTSTVNNSTISGNSAPYGGGILISGRMTVTNSTISGNSAFNTGGGIFMNAGILKINNTTISGNSVNGNSNSPYKGGGGIYNSEYCTLEVTNSTISGNSSANYGGGIYNSYQGTLKLLFSTITQNLAVDGGGVYNAPGFVVGSLVVPPGTANVRNTIIASNLNSNGGVNPDVFGTFTSNGYNLIGDSTGSTGFDEAIGDLVGTSDNPIDPRLAPLDFYGGPTQTIALLPDSPAIDAADPTILDTDPTTDQRGFPRVINGRSDIGAFEFS